MKASTPSPGLLPPLVLLGLGVVLLVAIQPYAAGYGQYRVTLLQSLLTRWGDPTWQHIALAPLISAFLVWQRRFDLARLSPHPAPAGLPLIILALFFYFAGYKANNYYFGFASIQLLSAGAVLWLLGMRALRLMFFPWIILAFSWPLVFLEDSLAFQLRLVVLEGVSQVLNLLHVPTLRDGTALISAPTDTHHVGELFRLQVDGPCSGMRSLFALMMVGALFSYFRQPNLPGRLVLFTTTIPLAILANMVRVLILLAASAAFGQDFAVGNQEQEVSTFHFVSGIAVFIVALMGLQIMSSLINRVSRPASRGKVRPKANPGVALGSQS